MSEIQPVPLERDDFIRYQLRDATVKDNSGNPVNLRSSMGDRYPMYEELVLERVRDIDTPSSKRQSEEEFELRFGQSAREVGFSGKDIGSIKARGRGLYRKWLSYKYDLQAKANKGSMDTRAGTNPHIFLGDNSGRRSLGYTQSGIKD